MPDLSYLNNEELLKQFNIYKQQAQEICEPLSELLDKYTKLRVMLDSLAVECDKRNIQVNLLD